MRILHFRRQAGLLHLEHLHHDGVVDHAHPLGQGDHFCYKWLPRVMKAFQRQFPGIEMEIGNALEAEAELADGRYDIVVTAVPGRDPA